MLHGFGKILLAAVALLFASQVSQAQDAITAPAQKQIGAAKSEMVPLLIVMNARGASLEGGTLTGVTTSPKVLSERDCLGMGGWVPTA
jgi:hypothetical protein